MNLNIVKFNVYFCLKALKYFSNKAKLQLKQSHKSVFLPPTPQDMNNSKLFSDEAANIYERAIGTLLKKNMLLYFAFADYEEVRVHYELCTRCNPD